MGSNGIELHGPIDFLLVEFDGHNLHGEAADAMLDLVERGVIRLYDLLVIRKDDDGTFSGVNIADLGEAAGGFTVFAGAGSGLIHDDDVREAAEAMLPGTMAALIIYENAWAIPFVRAVHNSGAQVIASARIPADVVNEALDALEA